LTAAAAATSRIRLGALIASPNFRHPVPFAKELMTLDDVSEGRLTLGLGAGTATGFDATALGQEPWSARERADRFEEFVTLLDALLTQPATSHRGRFYSADEARAIPGCVQRPRVPFAIAADGPRGMRLAARFAASWVTTDGRAGAAGRAARIDEICASEGRDPSSLDRLVLLIGEQPLDSIEAFREIAGRYRELGFTDLVVRWPERPSGVAVLEQIAGEPRQAPARRASSAPRNATTGDGASGSGT
jgi:alkanesulfonate monooxygenase SsuD/methylene tetrahydromethanopterin reductase-like flavin-dependent oxidoreductase (luciferase family)